VHRARGQENGERAMDDTDFASRYLAQRRAECLGAIPATDPCVVGGSRSYRLLNVPRCVFRVSDAGWDGNFALHFRTPDSGGCYLELDSSFVGDPPDQISISRETFEALAAAWDAMMMEA
jgi:hypothetical protein